MTFPKIDGTVYDLRLNLAYEIIPLQCVAVVRARKIEVKLKKKEGVSWTTLEEIPKDVPRGKFLTLKSSVIDD